MMIHKTLQEKEKKKKTFHFHLQSTHKKRSERLIIFNLEVEINAGLAGLMCVHHRSSFQSMDWRRLVSGVSGLPLFYIHLHLTYR